MQRGCATTDLKRPHNPILESALMALALTLSATPAYALHSSKPAASKPPSDRRIIASVAHRKLALGEKKQVVKIYDVAVGTPANPSPNVEFRITKQLENPTYSQSGVVTGPATDIHGTHRPDSIGHKASHGCVRLRNREAEELFARVKVGDHVSLIAERSDEVTKIFGPVPGSSSTLAARSEVRFSSAEEQSSDR